MLGALVLAVMALAWSAAALAESGGNSAATITGSFSDLCRDFAAKAAEFQGKRASKRISQIT